MARNASWTVDFYDSRDAWQAERSNASMVFEDGEMARLWARTQDMASFPLTALCCEGTVVAMFIVPPRDGSLMRQERAEIPVIAAPPAGLAS